MPLDPTDATSPSTSRRAVVRALLIGAALLGNGICVRAQDVPDRPPTEPESYVLLAFSKAHVFGPVELQTGSVGVNDRNGELIAVGVGAVLLDTTDAVIAGNKVRLQNPSTCAALFTDNPQGAEPRCGTVEPRRIPAPQPPLVADLESSSVCSRPKSFPKCNPSEPVTVPAGTQRSLQAGIYGALEVNGGTLTLEGGEYVFCEVTTENGSGVIAAGQSTVYVADSVNVLPDSLINPGGSPADLRVVVDGKGQSTVNILGGSLTRLAFTNGGTAVLPEPRAQASCVFISPRGRAGKTTVVAELCAPRQKATLNLSNAVVVGTFVADEINVGELTGGLPPPTTTTTVPTTSTTSSTATTTSTTTSSTTTSTTTTTSSTTSTSTSTSSTTTSSTSSTTTSSTTTSTSSITTTSSTTTSTSVTSTTTTMTTTSTSTSSTAQTTTTTSTSAPPSTAVTSTSTSSTSTSSTSLPPPPCDVLEVTSIRLKPRKDRPGTASLSVRGVLAYAGWDGVSPRQSGVGLGAALAVPVPSCCTIEGQFWMRPNSILFDFWDKGRGICPPLRDMRITVRRSGRAEFRLFAPRVDLPGMAENITIGVVVGDRCSTGTLPSTSLRRKGRSLVYP